MLGSVAVILATTLAERRGHTRLDCAAGGWFRECQQLDVRVTQENLRWPWAACVGALLVAASPTVLLRSHRRTEGILRLCASLAQALLCMLAVAHVPHRSLAYSLSLHGSVAVLGNVKVGPWFVCRGLWAVRHLAAWLILLGAFLYGPALSVVEWPGRNSHVTCSAVVHLIGVMVPGACVSLLGSIGAVARDVFRIE